MQETIYVISETQLFWFADSETTKSFKAFRDKEKAQAVCNNLNLVCMRDFSYDVEETILDEDE